MRTVYSYETKMNNAQWTSFSVSFTLFDINRLRILQKTVFRNFSFSWVCQTGNNSK